MKPRTWILLIAFVLILALATMGYLIFNFLLSPRDSVGLSLPINVTCFHIDIRDYGFMPENFTLGVGEEIVWKNLGVQNHSVVFPGINLNSGILIPGADYSVVFNYSGEFTYGCGLHSDKIGKIIVK